MKMKINSFVEIIKMKYKTIVCLTVMLLVGSANAYIGWMPSVYDANAVSPVGNWNIAANWDLGYVPTTADEVRFVNSPIPCLIDSGTDAVCLQAKLGDNGDNTFQHVLTIQGSLTTSTPDSWSSAGYNRSGTINVERGGSFINSYRIGIGLVDSTNPTVPSVININGGEMTTGTGGNLQIGTVGGPIPLGAGHIGIVNVKSGTLYVGGDLEFRDLDGATGGSWSRLDIRHGTLTVAGNEKTYADALIANGSITGFGGLSTPTAVYADGVTTLTATDPLNHSPKMDAVVPVGDVDLSWINVGTAPVGIEVWFGTDLDNLARVTDPNTAINITTTTVNAPIKNWYIWRVDTYDDISVPGEPNELIAGETMYFYASDDQPPSVDMVTVPTATWINQPVQLDITVTDDGKSTVTYLWESSDPNAVFSPSNTVAEPTVTMDYLSGTFTVTVTVSDDNPLGLTDAASVNIYCASTPCAAARPADGINLAVAYPADINDDCMHDLLDFRVLAQQWQLDYTITEPQPDTR
jgi:hypothetical protein